MTENSEQQGGEPISDRDHKELCLLFENAVMNLEALKRRAWATYASYSAIAVFFIHYGDKMSDLNKYIPFALLIGGVLVQLAQAIYRKDIKKI